MPQPIRRVGLVFSGGPAPGANAVISAAANSFLEDGREVVGFFHGYSNLIDYHPVTKRLVYVQAEGEHWWAERLHFLDPVGTFHETGQHWYKARWNSP